MFRENAKILRDQAGEIFRSMSEGDVAPGPLDPIAVLSEAGGPFGLRGIKYWCGGMEVEEEATEVSVQ